MATRAPRTVVNISLTDSSGDYDTVVTFLRRKYRIVRIGTNGDVAAASRLVVKWREEADAFAISGLHSAKALGFFRTGPWTIHRAIERLTDAAGDVPVTTGGRLTEVLQEWGLRRIHAEMPGYFTNARTVVLGHGNHSRAVEVLHEHTANIDFTDPSLRVESSAVMQLNPFLSQSLALTKLSSRLIPGPVLSQMQVQSEQLSASLARKAARSADLIIGTPVELAAFDLPELAGKTVATTAISDAQLEELAAKGVDLVLDPVPQPFDVTVVAATLEAMMLLALPTGEELDDGAMLEMITRARLEPRSIYPAGPKRKSRFAFVIHPLSRDFFHKVEPMGTISQVPGLGGIVEKAAAMAPPFVYSHVTGIKSPTGAEAEGWLLAVGGTPKELLSHSPEFTYNRLLEAADIAQRLGAQIMGLGAFTKVVGDAGITVAKKAPLPITTGNSYSASGALWAAADAVRKLDISEVDKDGHIKAKAMVVGATGSIGSVCARLLALVADEVWLVSPETAKLLALKQEIEDENPRATVHCAAKPDRALRHMDVIVTATSAGGKKVLDIMDVKPGAVITDVARPLDLSAEDVAKRPDVLVIESGEVVLPGEDVRMKSIGLPKGVVYACLAETVVLALEGRYEPFTVGRAIEWEKVREIYRLGLKHGMGLATISGVNGVFTDADFDRVRELALAAREGN
ncbi:MAG: dehydrogenase [Micrococcales bacterium]|nr:dehydrogenase [Micrococcales bacterium]